MKDLKWHTFDLSDVFNVLKTDPRCGLSDEEASRRLSLFGKNELPKGKGKTFFSVFLSQFKDFLIVVLLVSAVVSAFLGEMTDAFVIMIVVLLNSFLGAIQEMKAEKSLKALKELSTPLAKVIRNSEMMEIDSRYLVPGDIVILEPGNYVPADGRVVESFDLTVNESALTGESVSILKTVEKLDDEDATIADMRNMVFSGTLVVNGRGKMVVVKTGLNTEMGKIAELLSEMREEATPLQRNLEILGKRIGILILSICAVVFIGGILEGLNPVDMFLTSVSLAVAAIPEGLPIVVTIVLALGMQNMAKRNVIVRRLSAVEGLGSVNTICTDKTGTLTKNEMTVRRIFLPSLGKIELGKGSENLKDDLKLLLTGVILCNDSMIKVENGEIKVFGDPTETALITLGVKFGLLKDDLDERFPRVKEIPFSPERKMMTTVNEFEGGFLSLTKGAPDIIMERCSHFVENGEIKELDDEKRARFLRINEEFAENALRVLGVAFKRFEKLPEDPNILEKDMIFVGFVGMMDPPREEVKEAIEKCKKAGIDVIMITGDHAITAKAIAKELKIVLDEDCMVIGGKELSRMDVEDLVEVVEKVKIYARVSPSDKLKIVEALKFKDYNVAMTGDGVNDAPALKRADIGVAMGKSGTDVAKEASDMILLDDNFASIVSAIEEGRKIFENIKKFVYFILSCNVSEVAVILLSILARLPLPLIPVQILWMNLVTDSLPALAIGVEPQEEGIMDRPPRDPKESFLNLKAIFDILIGGAFLTFITFVVFLFGLNKHPNDLDTVRTMVFFTISSSQLFHALNSRSLRYSIFSKKIGKNPTLFLADGISMALLLLVIYLPPLQGLFHTKPLFGGDLLLSLVLSASPIPFIEFVKFLKRSLKGGRMS